MFHLDRTHYSGLFMLAAIMEVRSIVTSRFTVRLIVLSIDSDVSSWAFYALANAIPPRPRLPRPVLPDKDRLSLLYDLIIHRLDF